MAQSFIEKLESSKELKIKYKGKMYPVPPPIFRQARKFAIESVGIDYDIFKNNPTSQKSKDKEVKKAFEGFLESYLEAIVPQTKGNPSAKKITAAFEVMDSLVDAKKPTGVIQTFFGNKKTDMEKHQLASALKGAIMIITHIYTEGAANKPKAKYGFKADATKDEQAQVQYDRLFRGTVGFLVMSLVDKLYKMDPKEIERVLKAEIPPEKMDEFWRNSKNSSSYFTKLKGSANATLQRLDVLDIVRNLVKM